MPCAAKPQFRRGRLPRCTHSLELLRAEQDRPTAELWAELSKREPALELSVTRNTLRHLERRRYVVGTTFHVPNAPGGRQVRWSLTKQGRRVLERFERICAARKGTNS